MKTNYLKGFIVLAIVVLSSCGIDNGAPKPDYTKAGKQMFDQTEVNMQMLTDWIDVMLKINTYIQAPDANKIAIEDKYFTNFKIRNSALNTWSLIELGDTIYQVIIDGNPFTKAGATWKIKTSGMTYSCPFTCVDSKNWLLKVSNFAVQKRKTEAYYSNNTITTYIIDSLNFKCDTDLPESFNNYNFQVSGKGKFSLENYSQSVMISFEIVKDLNHIANSYFNMNSGKYNLYALDLDTSKSGTSTVEFETLIGDNRKITVVYNGRTQVYPTSNYTPL